MRISISYNLPCASHVKKVAQPTLNFKMKLVAAKDDDIEFHYIWKSDLEILKKPILR